MAQITKMLSGVVLMSLLMSSFLFFYQGGVDAYAPTDFNSTALEEYKGNLNEVSESVKETQESLEELSTESGVVDLLGGLLNSGLKSLQGAAKSIVSFFGIIDTGVSQLPVGETFGNELKLALIALAMLSVIAVIFKALFKVDL